MTDVFLSYARENLVEAQHVAERLRSLGFSVWFDEDLPAHRPFSEVIEEQLEGASSVVVLWTRQAVSSQWVRSEANRGRETNRLVQLRLDDARLPMPFDQVQCVDWSKCRDSSPAWQRVVESISKLANRDPPSATNASANKNVPLAGTQRRHVLLAGGAVAIAGAAGFAGWRWLQPPKVSPQAQLLIQKGMDALQNNDALETQDPGSTLQAIALLTDATRAAPESSVAWGALAMAYAVRKRTVELPERPGLEARSRAAAKTALELDPTEARALGALRLLDPVYRNWARVERADRQALAKNPKLPILLFIMSDMLGSVGRWREAASYSRQLDRKKFLIPGADRKLVIDLWSSGDLPGADAAMETAVSDWPQHPQIWRTHLAYLMYSGRPTEALARLRNIADRPAELTPEYFQAVQVTAEALAGMRPAAEAISHDLGYLAANPAAALPVAQACVALGEKRTALDLLDGYYFAKGRWAKLAPKGGDQDRLTGPLFQPSMTGIWKDAGFDKLLRQIGLADYWRMSGTLPDYRRA